MTRADAYRVKALDGESSQRDDGYSVYNTREDDFECNPFSTVKSVFEEFGIIVSEVFQSFREWALNKPV